MKHIKICSGLLNQELEGYYIHIYMYKICLDYLHLI